MRIQAHQVRKTYLVPKFNIPNELIRSVVFQNGTCGSASLSFNIDETNDPFTCDTGMFGIFVPDLGESYGRQDPIMATKGQSWPHSHVADNSVSPQRTAASQDWYGEFTRAISFLTLFVEY